jgi:hypothetical protein
MHLGIYAHRAAVGEQTSVTLKGQGQARRTKSDTTFGCTDQEGGQTQGVPLHRRDYPSVDSSPRPQEETCIGLPAASQSMNLLVVRSQFSSSNSDDNLVLI